MDSNTFIRTCVLFTFDQGKITKAIYKRNIYPGYGMTELTCERLFVKFQRRQPSFTFSEFVITTGLSRIYRELDALKYSIVNL